MTTGLGIKVGLLEVAVMFSVWPVPKLIPVKLTVWDPGSSLRDKLARLFKVGGWDAATTTVKVFDTRLLWACPLLAVTVMVVVPNVFVAGVNVRVPVVAGLL